MTKELQDKIDRIIKEAPTTVVKLWNVRDNRPGAIRGNYTKKDTRIKWVINGYGFVTAYDASLSLNLPYHTIASRCASSSPKWTDWMKLKDK